MDVPERIWACPQFNRDSWGIEHDPLTPNWTEGYWDLKHDGSKFEAEYILAIVSDARVAAARAEGFTAGCERMRETVASDLEEFAETMRYRNPNPEPMKTKTDPAP